MSSKFRIILIQNTFSCVEYNVAFVAQYPISPKCSVISCGELLFTCRDITCAFVSFA